MATLEDLLADPQLTNRQAIEDALFERSQGDILRQSEDEQRRVEEGAFGRGLGLSTVARDLVSERERQTTDALTKARNDAFLAAQAAVLPALAQATQQQQFQQTLGQRKNETNAARDQANKMMWAQAGAGLGGAGLNVLGQTFGPEIRGSLRGLAGLEPLRTDQWMTSQGGQPPAVPGSTPSPSIAAPPVNMPSVSAPEMPAVNLPGVEMMGPSMGFQDFSGFGGMDPFGGMGLESLFNFFDPTSSALQGWYE